MDDMSEFGRIMALAKEKPYEAAQVLGTGLMRGNRREFRLGYSARAAWMTCVDAISGLTEDDTSQLNAFLQGFALGMAEPAELVYPAEPPRETVTA